MNEETIDVSEWLHQSYHKAYPHAMQHVTENNGRYSTNSKLMFDTLYALQVLNDSQLASAEFLFSLHEVATNKTGYARMLNSVQNQPNGDKISGFCPLTLFKLITQHMGRLSWSQVERICIKDVRHNDIGWINKCKISIGIAFEDLGKAIEISIDILKQRLQNEPNYEGHHAPKI